MLYPTKEHPGKFRNEYLLRVRIGPPAIEPSRDMETTGQHDITTFSFYVDTRHEEAIPNLQPRRTPEKDVTGATAGMPGRS
jgi:hypothetical protein